MTAHAGGAALFLSDRSRLARASCGPRRRAVRRRMSARSASRQFARILRRSQPAASRPAHRRLRRARSAKRTRACDRATGATQRAASCTFPRSPTTATAAWSSVRYARDAPLRPNRYGIAEPDARRRARIAVRHLDLVLVPLVAVDPRGTRLGTGAGFYDRCLHHLRAGRRWRRPKLIGLGYEFQRVDRLAAARLGRAAGRAAHRARSLPHSKGSP